MSKKMWIVMQREFAARVRKKSFIIMTILMPFLMAALVFVPLLLSMVDDGGRRTVAVIDNTGQYADAFVSGEDYLFVQTEKMSASLRSDSADVFAVVQITGNLIDFPDAAAIYSRREVPSELRKDVERILTEEVRKEKFSRYDIPELKDIIADVQEDVSVSSVRWTDDGGEQVSMSEFSSGVGMLLTFLIYMFVLSYGAMVMQSVIEEKTNRIVELMVSSVRPLDLMLGKIVGIGCVGLLQMLIWGILLAVILGAAGVVAVGGSEMEASVAADPEFGEFLSLLSAFPVVEVALLFVLYFVGGYLLYAAILTAFGAAVNEQQDSQQFMMPVLGLMMFAFYAGFYGAQNPEGPLAFWTSFIPFTSPIVMMVRIPFGVPVYQEILSVALLYATAFGILWVSARIYRVGILMYGKKPGWKDLAKWVRYK